MQESKYRPNSLHGDRLYIWAHSLADLIVDDERADWIQAQYPFEDVGRPGILAGSSQESKPRKVTPEKPRPENEHEPTWRQTHEFLGSEGELETEAVA